MMTEWRSPTAGAGRWAWQASLGLAVLLICVTGCAMYRVGNGSLYRPDIRTVHVPMVESDSFRRNIGEQLTEAIVKEIELKTPYKVVGSDRADSVLNARIVTEQKKLIARSGFDSGRDVETDFFVQLSWVDRRGDLIGGNTDVPVPPVLVNVGQSANFVPEAGQSLATAHQEALRRLAKQIVGQMEAGW